MSSVARIGNNIINIIMIYKVTFKRFRFDTDNTIVFIDAKTAKAAADVVRRYYCVESDDILYVTPEK